MAAPATHEGEKMQALCRKPVLTAAAAILWAAILWGAILWAVILWAVAAPGAESFRRGGTEFNALRPVSVSGKAPIVVTWFFHHGEITPDGKNVVVSVVGSRREELVPMRILQLGPGDFCRLAFQPTAGPGQYEVLYGGEPPAKDAVPAWTSKEGLLLETRRYKDCNLNNLDSVRNAFNSATPIGGDYVENVHHSSNPFSVAQEPFLSRYSGYLHITTPATYGFITSSQDCSFLLVDDKLVVAAPGRHGPAHNAQRGSRKDIKLPSGVHKFEYHHAAAGPTAIMVAAWEINATDEKPQKVVAIPADTVFHSTAVAHVLAGPVTLRGTKQHVPDFLAAVTGEVPLPENNVPLVRVAFKDVSPKALAITGKVLWDFGDGQTSDKANPDHVYLRPGVYAVKLSFKRAATKAVEMTNRINVDRPTVTAKDKEKFHTLDQYLPVLQTYDPRTLDAASLRQLVAAYEAKALELEAKADEKAKTETAEKKPPPRGKKPADDKARSGADQYFSMAVDAGKVAFLEKSAARGDDDLLKLAQLITPMARDRLADSQLTFQIWKGAAQKINVAELKAECEAEAADVAVNDLVRPEALKEAKTLLDAATAQLGNRRTGTAAGKVQRAWGDYYALTGDGKAARKAYQDAEQILGSGRRYIERTAWRGAHSRSTEEFILQGQLDRAAAEIRAWLREFPSEKLDGYVTLMYARYWMAREKYAQAIAQADQLATANPDSPYIDQVLKLSAECELKRGRTDGALATLHRIVTKYPGSPLVPEIKKLIAQLEGGKKK
jgi:PKD repeat protein